jgi:predicted transport protein
MYTEEDHLQNATEEIAELYQRLKNQILNLGNKIEIKPKKQYLAFKASSNVVDVHIQRNKIKLWLNLRKGNLQDPYKLARDVSQTGHWGNGDYEVVISSPEQIINVISLVSQSYKTNS